MFFPKWKEHLDIYKLAGQIPQICEFEMFVEASA